ncbi:MAG: M23 family metallopeptidase, partial [Actinobacteria bacterium]|nr:M23 family metallopeptidase [Actinomycetota bacterium]
SGQGPRHPSLKGPTAKAAAALAAVAAFALGAGWLLGLPLPLLGDSESRVEAEPASAQPLVSISAGTPVGLTEGPYHPVVLENPDYGEGPAKFGAPRSGRRHEGQDVFARPGTPLVAVRDGIVLDGGGGRSFYSYGGGNTFVMYSPIDDRSYVYLHMLKPALVEPGERVRAGQLIGRVGCTGSCYGPHLHFEVREGRAVYGPQKKAVDPLPLLKQWPVRPAG